MQEFIGSLFPFVGACAVVYGLVVPRWQVARTSSWPSVTGVITKSIVGKSAGGSNAAFGSANTYYSATVKYKYQVGKRNYHNGRIHAGGSYASSIPSKADELAARYYEGAEVDVYFNPDNPSDSCLEKIEETSLLYIGIGILLLSFGYMFG